MKTIDEWVEENKGKLFRFSVYNKFNIWTPKQQERCYDDETKYESFYFEIGELLDVIDTPNGVLLEFDMYDNEDFTELERIGQKRYVLLNDVALYRFEYDDKEHKKEEEEWD